VRKAREIERTGLRSALQGFIQHWGWVEIRASRPRPSIQLPQPWESKSTMSLAFILGRSSIVAEIVIDSRGRATSQARARSLKSEEQRTTVNYKQACAELIPSRLRLTPDANHHERGLVCDDVYMSTQRALLAKPADRTGHFRRLRARRAEN
jgi:hypothetical protein